MNAVAVEPPITQTSITEVRFKLYQEFPFWAVMLERFSFFSSNSIPTACVTDEANIYINPTFWNTLTVAQRAFVMAHEVAHKAFDHFRRRGGRDHKIFNVAGDFAINALVAQDMTGRAVPPGVLMDARFDNLTAETIYDLIEAMVKKSKGGKGNGTPGDGSWTGDLSDVDPDDNELVAGSREITPKTEQEWKVCISSSMVAARMRGMMPAGLERQVLRRLESEVDWTTRMSHLLRQSLVNAGNKDHNWLPPSRRFIHTGWYFPRLNEGRAAKIVWAVDTSGSMSEASLLRAFSEIEAARRIFGVDVYVMDCDAQVYSGKWIRPMETLPMPKGGGGTDFRPVFDHVRMNELNPDCLVFFTDTEGEFPPAQPDYPVLWVVDSPGARVPWGEMIQIKE